MDADAENIFEILQTCRLHRKITKCIIIIFTPAVHSGLGETFPGTCFIFSNMKTTSDLSFYMISQ